MGLGGALLLGSIYRRIQSSWPTSYVSLSDYAAYQKASLPYRYLLFRYGPVVLVGFFGGTLIREQAWPTWPFVLAAFVVHTGATSLRAAWREIRPRWYRDRHVPLIIGHLVSVLVVFAALAGPAYFGDRASALAPDLAEVRNGIWAGLIGSALTFTLIRMMRAPERTVQGLIVAQRQRIGDELRWHLRDQAEASGLDPDLMEAVMIAEALQRPRWFRVLERIKGLVFRKGTYGVMQVQSDRPLSDRESIDIAVSRFSGVFQPGGLSDSSFYERLAEYNPSDEFASVVEEVYIELRGGIGE